MSYLSITNKNGLTISYDPDFLKYRRDEIIKEYNEAVADKTLIIDKKPMSGKDDGMNALTGKHDILSVLSDFETVMQSIISGKLDIFDSIPLTKAGLFNKNTSYLVKTANIENVYNTIDYFSKGALQLRLVPIPYPELISPCSKYIDMGYVGDGKNMFLEVGFFERKNSKEQAILDSDNNISKIEVKRNTYLKDDEIQVGHRYVDAKDVTYIYLGRTPNPFDAANDRYAYCKLTKKAATIIASCESVEDIFNSGVPLKQVEHPVKFIKEVE